MPYGSQWNVNSNKSAQRLRDQTGHVPLCFIMPQWNACLHLVTDVLGDHDFSLLYFHFCLARAIAITFLSRQGGGTNHARLKVPQVLVVA